MRIVCTSIEEFIQGLSSYGKVFLQTVNVNIARRQLDDAGITFEVFFNASSILQGKDDGEDYEILLEFAEKCGKDFEEVEPELEGSAKAKMLKSKVEEYAATSQLRVLPGIIGY